MRHAFTLLELAIVLIVVGLISVFAVQALSTDDDARCYATTEAQLSTIDSALQNFIATHKRLPKPAAMGLGSANPAFGYEAQNLTDPQDAAYASDVPSGVTNAGGVLIGALPHATLGLENSYASDCWGDKFTYAVTNALTSSNASNGYPGTATGTITLNSNTLSAPQTLSSTIGYVVLSHGADKYGATAMSASNTTPAHCNGSTAAKIDRENCNSDAVFFSSTRNHGTTDHFFDDLVVHGSKLKSTEPCTAQPVQWLTDCSGISLEMVHGASGAVSNSAPGFSGTVTVTCNDSRLEQSSPSCTVSSGPATCASEGLNDGEGNYDAGSCTLTSCCSGALVTSSPSPCPVASYIAGAGQCPPASCDNDASDGLTGGQQYCSGTVIGQGSGSYVCSGGLWGASYPFSCNGSQCQSGSASSSITSTTSGCPTPPDCSNGDTVPIADCDETAICTCN